jgi:hypothetical protein
MPAVNMSVAGWVVEQQCATSDAHCDYSARVGVHQMNVL